MTPEQFQAIRKTSTPPVATAFARQVGVESDSPACNAITCCGDDEPVANYTSDHPEHETFVAVGFFKDPPRIDDPPNEGETCVVPSVTSLSDIQGRIIASFDVKKCVWEKFTYPPSDEGGGDPPPPDDGGEVPMVCNDEIWCEFICDDGGTYHHHVPAGTICELTKALANAAAQNLCNMLVMTERFCISGDPPCACINEYYQWDIAMSGQPGVFSVVEATGLPPGLAVAGMSIVGIPVNIGSSSVYLVVRDANGNFVERTITIRVIRILTGSPLPSVLIGEAYTQFIQCEGCPPGATFSVVSGSLPPGLTLSEGGMISGTPTDDGTYNFEIGVSC